MMRFTRSSLVLLLALTAGLSACGKKPTPEPPAPVVSPPPPPPPPAPAARPSDDGEESRRAAERARRAAVLAEQVYFDYDRSDLSADARAVLDRKVTILREDAGTRIRIEGHADDRGSDEYNLALGMRRAASVKRYLASRGLPESRFDVASFGEERPAVTGSGESVWSRNRRAEFQASTAP